MTWKLLLRASLVGIVGSVFVAPHFGCEGGGGDSSKPTIDTTTQLKAPEVPTVQKVEVKKKGR